MEEQEEEEDEQEEEGGYCGFRGLESEREEPIRLFVFQHTEALRKLLDKYLHPYKTCKCLI